MSTNTSEWSPSSWRSFPALQQPDWPDEAGVETVLKQLRDWPPLVFAGEARDLRRQLGAVSRGEAFLIQAGDCAESFESMGANDIREKLRVILQMAVVLTYAGGLPTVKVGRIAGQFAKPRSSDTEHRDGVELPSFRGHIVNDIGFDAESRVPRPDRLLEAYNRSASTLNLVRAFTRGGFADLRRVHAWNKEFVADSPQGQRYEEMARGIDKALQFMSAIGIETETDSRLHESELFTSHEALLLGYEEALTRQDSLTGDWYDCSAHMVWIGERTRQLDGAHIEFFRGIKNPVGCKIGPNAEPEEVLALCEALNPDRIEGRLTLISRMGSERVGTRLPPLVEAVRDAGHPVVWACDPMHGNTFTAKSGRKTRHFEDIASEIDGFFAVHRAAGTWAGGVHLELTGDDVTECLGGSTIVGDDDLEIRYETMCDPRLNARQSLDLAFRVAELLHPE
ncbi:MAG: 3-deoxy-7-phosphoheptulonate synthase class II [Acidimicrobiia bacterium]|nr:3-deoxy-7-phosphoheptulonate synthase class II [Acidimicrobiia bacterium]